MAQEKDELLPAVRRSLERAVETIALAIGDVKIVVGVSGGPDSLALLHALRQLLPRDNLIVAHLDHGLRPESRDEAVYVRTVAAAWELPCETRAVDVAELARRSRMSVEEAGRQARYRFLAEVARHTGAAAIATGHNADDQVETVLMHIIRGSGLAGLRGMHPAAPLPESPSIWLLRPLLDVSRATIETYCRANNLRPLLDATNEQTTFFRNRLRHELLPLLETYNPQIRERLRHLAAVVAADNALLDNLAVQAYGDLVVGNGPGWVVLDREEWLLLPLALRRSSLRRALLHCTPQQRDIGFATLEAAREAADKPGSGQKAHLPGGIALHVLPDRLLLTGEDQFPASLAPQLPASEPFTLSVPGGLALPGEWVITAERVGKVDADAIAGNDDPWTAYVEVEPAQPLIVRGRRAGEGMQPLGMEGHEAKLKEIMINRKIPASLRARWPLVATSDHAVWLVGHVIDHRHRVTPRSETFVCLRCTRIDRE